MMFRSVVGIVFGLAVIAISSSFAPGALAQEKLWRIWIWLGYIVLGIAFLDRRGVRNPRVSRRTLEVGHVSGSAPESRG